MDMQTTNALIEAVKLHPSLYGRHQQSSGGNIDQKNLIWKEISLKIDQPIDKCKAKWRNLRDSYQKSIKWKQELEEIGKLSNYHEYKHEAALAFLESGVKRKSSTDNHDRRTKIMKQDPLQGSKRSVQQENEIYEAVYNCVETQEYSPTHAVEYLIETESQQESQPENEIEEEDASIFQVEAQEDEKQSSETVPEQIESLTNIHEHQRIMKFETNENIDQNEEITYQETFIEESPPNITFEADTTALDLWLKSVKETLLSLPKINLARAKKHINDIISEHEINYLESMDGKELA